MRDLKSACQFSLVGHFGTNIWSNRIMPHILKILHNFFTHASIFEKLGIRTTQIVQNIWLTLVL